MWDIKLDTAVGLELPESDHWCKNQEHTMIRYLRVWCLAPNTQARVAPVCYTYITTAPNRPNLRSPTWMRHLLTSLAHRALLQLRDPGSHRRNISPANISAATQCDFMILPPRWPKTPSKLDIHKPTFNQPQVCGGVIHPHRNQDLLLCQKTEWRFDFNFRSIIIQLWTHMKTTTTVLTI